MKTIVMAILISASAMAQDTINSATVTPEEWTRLAKDTSTIHALWFNITPVHKIDTLEVMAMYANSKGDVRYEKLYAIRDGMYDEHAWDPWKGAKTTWYNADRHPADVAITMEVYAINGRRISIHN